MNDLGRRGEDLAVKYLKRQGCRILERNVKCFCEMDVVCAHEGVVCFVEVKTRSSEAFGRPAEAVDAERQRRYRAGAVCWLRRKGLKEVPVRFDVVDILDGKVTWIKNAF